MKGENIATRLLAFGAGVVRLCRRLPDDVSAKHIARQLVRAATRYTIPDRIVRLGIGGRPRLSASGISVNLVSTA